MASEFQALHSWKAKPTYSSSYDCRDETPSYRSDRSEGRKDASSSASGTAREGGQNRQKQDFLEWNKNGRRVTPITVSDQSLVMDVGERATNAQTAHNGSDE